MRTYCFDGRCTAHVVRRRSAAEMMAGARHSSQHSFEGMHWWLTRTTTSAVGARGATALETS